MALIKCPECGKEISDKAASCPNCGMPLHPFMEKPTTSKAIPVICGTIGIAFPIIFGWTLYSFSPLAAFPLVLLLIVGITCLCGINNRRVSKIASILCALGIGVSLLFGIGFIVIFLILGFLEVMYYSKLST